MFLACAGDEAFDNFDGFSFEQEENPNDNKVCVGEANENWAKYFKGGVNVLMKGACKEHSLIYFKRTSGNSSDCIFFKHTSDHHQNCTFSLS